MPKSKKTPRGLLNVDIINSIITGQWDIEEGAAMRYLSQYMSDLSLLENGVPFEEIGFSQRRLELASTYITRAANGQRTQFFTSSGPVDLASGDIPPNSIAHLKLTGAMRVEDGLSSRGIKHLTRDIDRAQSNPNIIGILLEVNSGGGETIAGTMLQNAVAQVSKPFHVHTHFLASAALKGTLPADYVSASGNEVTVGSIGTMLTMAKWLVQYYKENEEDIYATKSTGKNKEFRAYLNGDKGPFIEKLDKVNEHFIADVKKFRTIKGSQEQREQVFSGETFLASEAIGVGLIDSVGTFNDALDNIVADAQRGASFQKRINRTAPAGPAFNNQNSKIMNVNKFWGKLYPILNSILGTAFQEDTDLEQALQDLEEVQPLAEAKEQIKQEIISELQPAASKDKTEEGQGDKTLEELVQELSQKMDAQTKAIEGLQADKNRLEGEVATLKGHKLDENEEGEHNKTNGDGNTPQSKFKTVQSHKEKGPGTSKY